MTILIKPIILISLIAALFQVLSGCSEVPKSPGSPDEPKKEVVAITSSDTGTIVTIDQANTPISTAVDCVKVTTFTGDALAYYQALPNTKTGVIIDHYFLIKKEFTDPEILKELAYEANITKEFVSSDDCSGILEFNKGDTYTYDLCKIYKAKDLKQLEAFSFDDGDEDMKITIQSLIEGKYLSGAKRTTYDSITQYNLLKTNITIDLTKDHFDGYAIPYYIYIQNNSKEAFMKKLDAAFISECEKTLKEE